MKHVFAVAPPFCGRSVQLDVVESAGLWRQYYRIIEMLARGACTDEGCASRLDWLSGGANRLSSDVGENAVAGLSIAYARAHAVYGESVECDVGGDINDGSEGCHGSRVVVGNNCDVDEVRQVIVSGDNDSSRRDDDRNDKIEESGEQNGPVGSGSSAVGRDTLDSGRSSGRADSDDNRVRGRWSVVNRKKRDKRKANKVRNALNASSWRSGFDVTPNAQGFCETVVSETCPSYGQALSDAEREAKESLARRRAAENAVAEKLAKMKLESLEDEQKCQEYAELKRQRVIQWTNEATAKSQQSLDKCKSIDPGSSASQYEIRRQAKELADLKVEFLEQGKLLAERVPDYRKILADRKPITSSSMDRHELEAEFLNDNDSIDLGNSMFDAPFSRTRPFGQLNNSHLL